MPKEICEIANEYLHNLHHLIEEGLNLFIFMHVQTCSPNFDDFV